MVNTVLGIVLKKRLDINAKRLYIQVVIEIRGHINPTVIKTISGTYAVSGSTWKSVPKGTTLGDIEWVKPKVEVSTPKEWKVKNYIVKYSNGGFYSCTCLGYTYRRNCKHIKEISEGFKSTK